MLFEPKEKGQGLVEYALIIALIAILLIAALALVTGALSTVFSRVGSAVKSADSTLLITNITIWV